MLAFVNISIFSYSSLEKLADVGDNEYICGMKNLIVRRLMGRKDGLWLTAVLLVGMSLLWSCADGRGNKVEESGGLQETEVAEKPADLKVDSAKVNEEQKAEAGDKEDTKEVPEGKHESEEGVMMSLMGNIGGSPATLDMDGRTGFYEYDLRGGKVKRNLELESYDKKSGRVVLRALDKNSGKLIGRFDGTFVIECATDDEGVEHCGNSYCGIFTNVKGAKVDFMLYID